MGYTLWTIESKTRGEKVDSYQNLNYDVKHGNLSSKVHEHIVYVIIHYHRNTARAIINSLFECTYAYIFLLVILQRRRAAYH